MRTGKKSLDQATDDALKRIPEWMKRSSTKEVFTRRNKRTAPQANRDNFQKKAERDHRQKKYSIAWKEATTELKINNEGPNFKKRGYGARAIAAKFNSSLLTSPTDRKINHETLRRAVSQGEFGISPVKVGKPPKVPKAVTKALATHSTMMQVAGDGEASRPKMIATAQALVAGTNHDGKFNLEYAWRKTRKEYPEILNPVKAKDHEDRRADWLTYANINQWTDAAKAYLIGIGMLKDGLE